MSDTPTAHIHGNSVDYMGRNVDLSNAEFRPLYDTEKESYKLPDNAPVEIANNPKDKKNKPRGTSEAPCPDDNMPANADSFAHRK